MMEHRIKLNRWIICAITIVCMGIILFFTNTSGIQKARAQSNQAQTSAMGVTWQYQLDFPSSPDGVNQLSANLTSNFKGQGVTSDLQNLDGTKYQVTVSGSQGLDQLRQVIYSPVLANFIGGAGRSSWICPSASLRISHFMLESNLTTR